MRELTPKRARFVAEYLVDLNATAAARRAGYSAHTAEQQGPRLLGYVEVQAAIAAAQEERAKRTQIDADWVLRRLALLADADMADIYGADGKLLPVAKWPDAWRRGLVAGVETVEDLDAGEAVALVQKVKIADRLKTLELLGRHVTVGAFREKLEVTGKDGGPLQTESAVQFYLPKNGR